VNYFLEPLVAFGLAVPVAWNALQRAGGLRRALAPVLGLVQLVLLFHVPNGFMASYQSGPAMGSTPVQEDVAVGAEVEAVVRQAGPNALVELAGFAVLAGAPVWLQPIDLQAETRRGRWTPDRLNASFAEHHWSVVVLSYKFLPPESMAALERWYVQTDGLSSPNGLSYFVYTPRVE
jgi:hypothetical protein